MTTGDKPPFDGVVEPGVITLEEVSVGGVRMVSGLLVCSVGGRLPNPLS